MSDLIKRLRETKEEMAHLCGLPLALWNEHSNAVLEAADRIEELEAALRYLVSECDEDMDDDYNPHYAPLAQARAALADTEKPE